MTGNAATAQAFETGWEWGTERARERRERREMLEDEQRQNKVTDLYNKRDQLIGTIAALGRNNPASQPYFQGLKDIEVALNDVYHPARNPGALQRDWHLLRSLMTRKPPEPAPPVLATTTEAGTPEAAVTLSGQQVTLPSTPGYTTVQPKPAVMSREQRQAMAQVEQARQRAEQDVLSGGLTPEQKQEAQERLKGLDLDWTLSWAQKHGVSGAALDELAEQLAGGKITKSHMLPLGKPYKAADGTYRQTLRDSETGVISEEEMPAGWTPPPAAPIRAWKKDQAGRIVSVLIDRNTNVMVPGSERSDLLPPSYLTPRISTGMYHFVDEDNQIHEVPETRTTTPILPGAATGTASAPAGRATTPSGTPAPTGRAAAPPAGTGAKGDRILGVKGSAPLNKARSDYAAAVKIANQADALVKDAEQAHREGRNVSEGDALFVLSLIRSEAGRVNAREIAQLFQAGGIEMAPDRWVASIGHGELSDDLRSQLQAFAHQQVASAQAAVDALRSTPGALKKQAQDNVNKGVSDDEFLQKVK